MAITVAQPTYTPASQITVVHRFVFAGAILQVVVLLVMLPPLLQLPKKGQMIQAITTSAFALFVLWQTARFRNWARRLFIATTVVRIAFVAPQGLFWQAMIEALLVPSTVATPIALAGGFGFLYSIAFTVLLFRRRIRVLFMRESSNRLLLSVLLGIGSTIAFCVGLFTADVERRISRLTPPSTLNPPPHLPQ